MKKKIKLCFLLSGIIVFIIITLIIVNKNKTFTSEVLDSDSAMAVMVYDDSVGDYVKSNEVPVGMRLNSEKTKCIAGGEVSNYDSQNGTITYHLNYSDYCYIYFDRVPLIAQGNDYTGTYDGNSHNITVNVFKPSSGYSIYYSTSPLTSSNYSTEGSTTPPSVVNAGDTTVYWCAVASNYIPLCGSNKVKINIAKMTAIGTDYEGPYDGNNHSIIVSVTNPAVDYNIYYSTTTQLTSSNYTSGSTTNPTRNAIGVTTVYWCAVANNYNSICSFNNVIVLSVDANIHMHSYESSITKPVTCEENGAKTYVCRCGDSFSVPIAATGHDYDEGIVVKEPTCEKVGGIFYTCQNCGTIYTEVIPEKGHQWVAGDDEYFCSYCGFSISTVE